MEEKLYDAIAAGNTSEALTLLDDVNISGWINETAHLGRTCLYWACKYNNTPVVSKLLTVRGVDVNKVGVWGAPLHAATAKENIDIIEILIRNGASCKGDWENITPLHKAAGQDNTDTLECLLKHFSTNINHQTTGSLFSTYTPSGCTPLHYAAYHGNIKAAKMLVKYGCDINIKTKEGKTAYDLAVEKKHKDVADYLKHVAAQQLSTPDELVSKVNQLEIKCDHLQSQCNELKGENLDLKTRVSKLEQTVRPKTNNNSNNQKGNSLVQCIQNNFTYLLESMCAEDHLDFLYQEKALSLEDYEVIRCEAGNTRKTREMLIRLMKKKNTEWVKVLQKSMEKDAKHLLHIFN